MHMSTGKVRSETTVLVETVTQKEQNEQEEGKEGQNEQDGQDDKEYTVSFKMTAKDHDRLEAYAKEHGLSKSMIIRSAVNKYVEHAEGRIEVTLPSSDYKNLIYLIESGQALSVEAAVAEAVSAYNLRKARELKEFKSAKAFN